MKYLIGSKEEFWKFLDSINKYDKAGIIGQSKIEYLEKSLNLNYVSDRELEIK